jgi:hypothetical protein
MVAERDFRFIQRRQSENRIPLCSAFSMLLFIAFGLGQKFAHKLVEQAETKILHIFVREQRQLIWAGAPSALDFRISAAAAIPGAFKQSKKANSPVSLGRRHGKEINRPRFHQYFSSTETFCCWRNDH